MKKIVGLVFIVAFLGSCSSGKVCGGKGGKRCVETEKTELHKVTENV